MQSPAQGDEGAQALWRTLLRSVAHRAPGGAMLPDEGRLGSFDRASGWINSPPLTPAEIRGRVVLVDFWTYTCVNWLRTLPYLKAWDAAYRSSGLTIVGVHTPEFGFERDPANVAERVEALGIAYPVALDAGYGVWDEFANHYWPAVYLADARGRLRYHRFGEGEYAMTEMAIQYLLAEAGATELPSDPATVEPTGLEVAADWADLRSPETYLGYGRSSGFVSDDPTRYGVAERYRSTRPLERNTWDLDGVWTVGEESATAGSPGARLAFAFHARDLNLIVGPSSRGRTVPFRVRLDSEPPGDAHGSDVGADGVGTVSRQDTLQLVRQPGEVRDRVFVIEFPEGGAEAFCVTFG